MGAEPGARHPDLPGDRPDQPHPAGPRRLPAAVPPPNGAGGPDLLLDHISGGRINFGVAASSIPTDQATFGLAGADTRAMMRESLDMILRLWAADAPFEMQGEYWKIARPEPMLGDIFRAFLKPVQQPHPPIGVAGLSPSSDTLKLAGERGFLPMSLNLNGGYLASHWAAVEAGAGRDRPHAGPQGLAHRPQHPGRRHRRGGAPPRHHRLHGPDGRRLFAEAGEDLRHDRLPQARPVGPRFGRRPRVHGDPQLDRRLSGHGRGQDRAAARAGGRLRRAAGPRLRLPRNARRLAPLARPPGQRCHAPPEAYRLVA
ncbi:MAG: LLM class flavin-dependent oxidoreductase [Caulobacteraceae bacterium]